MEHKKRTDRKSERETIRLLKRRLWQKNQLGISLRVLGKREIGFNVVNKIYLFDAFVLLIASS